MNVSFAWKVSADSLYLTDDTNHAIFANDNGEFPSFEMINTGHYEVHGDCTAITLDDQTQSSGRHQQHQQLFSSPTFAFAQRSSASTPCSLSASSTACAKKQNKTFQR